MAHNSIPSDNPSSVALALENAIALAVSRANDIVGDGTASPHGLAAADPDALADALEAANTFLAKLETIRRDLVLGELGRRARGTSPEETVIDNGLPRAPARAELEPGEPSEPADVLISWLSTALDAVKRYDGPPIGGSQKDWLFAIQEHLRYAFDGLPWADERPEPEAGEPDHKAEHDNAVNDALASLRTIHGIAAAILDGARDDVLDALHGAIYREALRGEAALDSRAVWRS